MFPTGASLARNLANTEHPPSSSSTSRRPIRKRSKAKRPSQEVSGNLADWLITGILTRRCSRVFFRTRSARTGLDGRNEAVQDQPRHTPGAAPRSPLRTHALEKSTRTHARGPARHAQDLGRFGIGFAHERGHAARLRHTRETSTRQPGRDHTRTSALVIRPRIRQHSRRGRFATAARQQESAREATRLRVRRPVAARRYAWDCRE